MAPQSPMFSLTPFFFSVYLKFMYCDSYHKFFFFFNVMLLYCTTHLLHSQPFALRTGNAVNAPLNCLCQCSSCCPVFLNVAWPASIFCNCLISLNVMQMRKLVPIQRISNRVLTCSQRKIKKGGSRLMQKSEKI